MDYNSRASQQFRSQPGGAGGRGRQQQHQNDSDAFMRLPDREIAGCISDIGVPFSPEDLLKPNPQQVQKVFEWFAELLMNTTRETVEPAMRAAAEDVCRDYGEIIPADTRNLMGFYVSLRKLLVECGINDFSFNDLLKPTHDRLVKIFSYIINFVRFRESQTATIDEHFNKSETTKARIETLYLENQDMEARLDEMKRARKEMDVQLKEKKRRNDELKARLLEMRKDQERISRRHDDVKGEKSRMAKSLEQKTERCLAIRQESEKLRPYVSQSPQALQTQLSDLSDTLARDRAQIEILEKRARALQTSHDTFNVLTTDVTSCSKILNEIHTELQKEEEENSKAAKRRDALSDRSNNVREVERKEKTLQRQLERWQDKTEQLGENSRHRQEKADKRMGELKEELYELKQERAEKERDISRRKVRIEQTEKKMADLKETIESEVHAAHTEYQKMDSHIRLYITEMEQSMGMVH